MNRLAEVMRLLMLAWLVSSGAVSAAWASSASDVLAESAPPPQGSLLIIGGALRPDNAEVWQRLVQLAGGQGARIAVLPSAAANPARSGAGLAAQLNHYGAAAFVVPLAVNLKERDYRRDADDDALAASIRASGGVYFAGGDQALITQALVRPDGSRSAVLQAIWDVYQRGGVIAGSSAGAAIMSSTMYYDAKTVIGTLSVGVNDGRELAPGLGFVGDQLFVDQHLLARGRFARMLPAMLKKSYTLGLGVDENTALVIKARREVEVIGYQGALLLDLSQASSDVTSAEFNLSNARISYLDHGDRYNLATRQYTPSADKADGKLDGLHPEMNEPVYSADILGHNAVLVLMDKLIDNTESSAIGIASAGPGQPRPELGFEFKFTRTADSIGYQSATLDAYSILNLRLDVRPVHIAQPWYR